MSNGYSFSGSWEQQLDHYLTTPPEERESLFSCESCGEKFYPGHRYYNADGKHLCRDCVLDWLDDNSEVATEEDCFREDGDY